MTNSTLSGNSAEGGGGIENTGPLTVTNSTLSGNTASLGFGGGIENRGPLTVTNSTLSGNTAGNRGGGIGNFANAALIYVTVASNSSGIWNSGGAATLVLTGTSVANSTSAPNCIGPISESAGYNLDSGASCGFSKSTDLTTTDPLLGPLFNYGGPTSTMALLPGSPAIDHGGASVNGCPTTDQRGVVRPQGPACDIGAYEATP